ncbi:MAG: NAD(P)H-dependent glycerol-3-phosphate dehydrogenase [Cytophagaceae bacterium]|nr:NAD(P)H-dependent glycerol-3-phosphate dehydrogenase [Cytophagaceae bacterium]
MKSENIQQEAPRVAVIGGGSWATALVKILSEQPLRISWWIRSQEDVKHIKEFGNNPRYLSNIQFPLKKIKPSTDLRKTLEECQVIILAVPSAFILEVLNFTHAELWKNKTIVSAIKGMIPNKNQLITEYMRQRFGLDPSQLCIIAGPCHSEEIALEKRSYLTLAGSGEKQREWMAQVLACRYVRTCTLPDLEGVEYAAIMKNIIAIACGLARGLNYGDNFQAVLVSNAMQEIKSFLNAVCPQNRDVDVSAYLGDLLVTCYSPYSRNRTLGYMVGKGYSVRAAMSEMNMIAEGYYAVKSMYEIGKQLQLSMPITKAVYNILYERISPTMEIKILENSMN